MATSISTLLSKQLGRAVTKRELGQEATDALNKALTLAEAAVANGGVALVPVAAIVALHVSQTTDFGILAVGDVVAVLPAAAGNSHFLTVATAGTLGEAAVVGSLYIILRSTALPAADIISW